MQFLFLTGTGFPIPQYAANALTQVSSTSLVPNLTTTPLAAASSMTLTAPPIATQCFMLSNMFDTTK